MVKISKKTNDIASTESTQEIQISSFRSDWKILALKDAVEYIDYGYSQAIPKVPPENGIKIVSTADINRDGELLYSQIRKVEAPLKTIARLTLRDGDVLFNWRNSANLIGKTTVFEEQLDPHIFASFILRLRCDEIISHNYYIKHLLNYFRYRGIFENLARRAVNQANYNKNEISVLKIPIPPIEEQRKIARVLYLVQDAIAQQEQLLTLTTELKKALMQKLFTEGTRDEPQKRTEIGFIPESWDVVKFEDFVTLQRGKDLPRYSFNEGNIPVIGATSVIGFHNKANVKGPGVTVVRSGSSAGKPLFIAKDFWAHNVVLYVKDFHGNNVKFSYYLIQNIDLTKYRSGVAVPTLNKNTFRTLQIALPSRDEQENIVEILDLIEDKIDNIQKNKIILQDLFRTLLHQLMTAQIRVDDLNLSAVNLEPKGGNE